jgi:hypothetical protein
MIKKEKASNTHPKFKEDVFPEFVDKLCERIINGEYLKRIFNDKDKFIVDFKKYVEGEAFNSGISRSAFYHMLSNFPESQKKYFFTRGKKLEDDLDDLRANIQASHSLSIEEETSEIIRFLNALQKGNAESGGNLQIEWRNVGDFWKTRVNRTLQSQKNEMELLRLQADLNPEIVASKSGAIEFMKLKTQKDFETKSGLNYLDNIETEHEEGHSEDKPLSFEERNEKETLRSIDKITELARDNGWKEEDLNIIKEKAESLRVNKDD